MCCKFIDKSAIKSSKLNEYKHECDSRFCKVCCKRVPSNHLCYIQPFYNYDDENMEHSTIKAFTLVVFDSESLQETFADENIDDYNNLDSSFQHDPILVISQRLCDMCYEFESRTYRCMRCQQRESTFFGDTAMDQFVHYLLQIKLRKGEKVTIIAHNAGMYAIITVTITTKFIFY